MTNNKAALIGLGVFGIIVVLVLAFWPQLPTKFGDGKTTPTPKVTQSPKVITDDIGAFNFVATYTGQSVWRYTVTAQLPTPCDSASVDTITNESYPESVTIRVITSKSNDYCIQVLKDFSYEGTFSASESATIRFTVND